MTVRPDIGQSIIVLVLGLVSFATRFVNLGHPNSVVFDELHYIKFISLYTKRIFFFNPQPPLGEQLLTFVAYMTNFRGDLSYSQIGEQYKPEVPIKQLRSIPCFFGSLIAPLCYIVSRQLRIGKTAATLVGSLIIVENSLITQSRFILLEPILIFFNLISLSMFIKYHETKSVKWLTMSSIFVALAACTKYSGFYSFCLIIFLTLYYWWSELGNLAFRDSIKRLLINLTCLIIIPPLIYISVYHVHLTWLIKAGPHDNIMSSTFQASLENGLATITKGQPLEIVHGSQVTLRHSHGRSCWLHSHEHLYPVKYTDGRGSSHQQQVTCYSFKDVNNWWIIKRPHVDEIVVEEPRDRIRDGQQIQIIHGMTGRALNSHDVASPMSPYSQEVSCYIDHNISMSAQNVWRVKLVNPLDTDGVWHTMNSRIQLIHLNSSLALRFSGRQLSDWGYHQHEVVADKELKHDDTIWNVEEHRYTSSDVQSERETQLSQAEFVPLEPTNLSFFQKFYELHYKLLTNQQDNLKDHIYACDSPLDWILVNKGTAYWVNSGGQDISQIFLITNVTTSIVGLICLVTFLILFMIYTLSRKRKIDAGPSDKVWSELHFQAVVLIIGYLIHIVPYFAYETPLFLQSYLSALVFKIILIGATIDHMDKMIPKLHLSMGISVLILAASMHTFMKISPLTYGTSLHMDDIESIRWKDTWQLISVNN